MNIKNVTQHGLDPYRSRVENDPQAQAQRMRSAETSQQTQGKADRVSVSPEARLMTEAYKTAMNTPDVRQEKIDAIKERIASGEYSVDAKSIAAKLMQADADVAKTLKD